MNVASKTRLNWVILFSFSLWASCAALLPERTRLEVWDTVSSLEAGDVIAVKGHTEDITEITLEPLHFSDTFPEEPIAEFTDRILVDEKRISVLGFTDADVIYVGFPNHDLNDYVVPKPGYTTEDGMLMQKLDLEAQETSAKQGSFSHPNIIISCNDEGCTSEEQREIRPEDTEPAQQIETPLTRVVDLSQQAQRIDRGKNTQ